MSNISEAINHEHQTSYEDLTALDHDLRHNRLVLFGSKVDLSKYSHCVKPLLNQSLNALYNSVGDGHDVSSILLVGGASHYFLNQIKNRYPKHNIQIAKDPIFANVRGFQKAGVRYAMANKEVRRRGIIGWGG